MTTKESKTKNPIFTKEYKNLLTNTAVSNIQTESKVRILEDRIQTLEDAICFLHSLIISTPKELAKHKVEFNRGFKERVEKQG